MLQSLRAETAQPSKHKSIVKSMLKSGLRIARGVGLVPVLKTVNRGTRALAYTTHKLQFYAEFGVDPVPDWFDHTIDQYYMWPRTQSPHAWERGILNSLVLKHGCRILELCSGDGFNSYHFYAARASHIVAMEYDREAFTHARKRYGAPNIEFVHGDVRTDMPEDEFDNIIWDAGIYLFTLPEIHGVLGGVKKRLVDGGILSGQTHVEDRVNNSSRNSISTVEELVDMLSPHFENVQVFETKHMSFAGVRTNVQFFASDGPLLFDATSTKLIG